MTFANGFFFSTVFRFSHKKEMRSRSHLRKPDVFLPVRFETYQNRIFGQFSAIIEKNGKSFGRLQASALLRNISLGGPLTKFLPAPQM
jgi:hypothetical protein